MTRKTGTGEENNNKCTNGSSWGFFHHIRWGESLCHVRRVTEKTSYLWGCLERWCVCQCVCERPDASLGTWTVDSPTASSLWCKKGGVFCGVRERMGLYGARKEGLYLFFSFSIVWQEMWFSIGERREVNVWDEEMVALWCMEEDGSSMVQGNEWFFCSVRERGWFSDGVRKGMVQL